MAIKRKPRITLNDVITQKLNEMEDTSALDVFTPKTSVSSTFQIAVEDAMKLEEIEEKEKIKTNKKISKSFVALLVFALGISIFIVLKIML